MAIIFPEAPKPFEFETKQLGKIEISPYPAFGPKGFRTKLRGEKLSNEQLFRDLIKQLGKKYASKTSQSAKKKISSKDVKLITEIELQDIAKDFVKRNEWLLKNIAETEKEDIKPIKKDTESFIDYAIRILKENETEWGKRLNQTASSFKSAMEFSNAKMAPLFAQLRDNMVISGTLRGLLASSPPQAQQFLKPTELAKLPKITPPIEIQETKFQNGVISYLDEFAKFIRSTASVIQSLNDTTIQLTAKISDNATKDRRITIIMLLLTMIGVTIGIFRISNDLIPQRAKSSSSIADSLQTLVAKQGHDLIKMEITNQRLAGRLDSLLNQFENAKLSGSIDTKRSDSLSVESHKNK